MEGQQSVVLMEACSLTGLTKDSRLGYIAESRKDRALHQLSRNRSSSLP